MSKSSFEEVLEKYGRLVYTNSGDSMLPFIHEKRDILIIEKPSGRLKKYDVPLYRRDSGQYVLHRILKVRENDYVICGDNRINKEYGITDRHIIGVLTAVNRNGKMIYNNNRLYRLYVHLWCDLFCVRYLVLKTKSIIKRIKSRKYNRGGNFEK